MWVNRAILLVAALAVCGCEPTPARDGRLVRVAAAANLKAAFEDAAAEFRRAHAEIEVRTTYGSSGQFAAQIANQAPFDLFLSADTDYPRSLAERGFANPDGVFRYAVGRLAVWVPNESPLDPNRGLAAAADPAVRKLAIANPRHAPYGRAAEAALRKAGLYDAVHPRLVFGENVEQATQFVHSGTADAGLLPLSLALSPNLSGRGRYWVVPAEDHPPLTQAGAILAGAADRHAAEAVRDFLLGPAGQAILRKYGYEAPGE